MLSDLPHYWFSHQHAPLSWQTRLQSGPAVDKAAAEQTDIKGQCCRALFSQFCYNIAGCLITVHIRVIKNQSQAGLLGYNN